MKSEVSRYILIIDRKKFAKYDPVTKKLNLNGKIISDAKSFLDNILTIIITDDKVNTPHWEKIQNWLQNLINNP